MTEVVYSDLIASFEAAELSQAQFTHEAHLRVGYFYASRFSLPIAGARLRDGIQRLNAVHGVQTTPQGGYHETITLLYLNLLLDFHKRSDKSLSPGELADKVVVEFADRELPLEYYSKERLFSWKARTRWLEPDLKSLPVQPYPWQGYRPRLHQGLIVHPTIAEGA